MSYTRKVAFIISSLNMGGAQRAVSNIVMNLPEDWYIRLILNTDENITYPYKGEIVSLGIPGGGDRKGLFYQAKVWFKRYRYVKKMKKTEQFDAVISFLDSANVLNILSGKSGKTIVSVRNRISEKKSWKYKYIVGPLIKKLYNRADAVVAVSESTAEDLVENFGLLPDKVKTIYNCYNVRQINERSQLPASIAPSDKDFNIVTVGRLSHQKGQWHLIRAINEVRKTHSNVHLYILGEGELHEYLQRLIDELNISDQVTLCGFVKDVYAVLGKMDLFVLPSFYEGLSNVLIEAMSCGIPCITTDYPGAREIVGNSEHAFPLSGAVAYADHGIIVPLMSDIHNTSGDKPEKEELIMADAISEMIKNEDLRKEYAKKSLERAEFFSTGSIIKEWEALIIG